jgi:hypothetical protein
VGRWLVEPESGPGFDLGLQYMAREPKPVVIRILDAEGLGGAFQPAITALQKRGQRRVHTLFTIRPDNTTGAVPNYLNPDPVLSV